jgi:phosphatidylinositol dimannoside acyltransferase
MSGLRRRLASRASVLAYLGGWRVVRMLPESVAYPCFDLLADVAWLRHGAKIARLEANLSRACPDLDHDRLRALSRQGARSYLRYWCDAFRLPGWSRERLLATVRAEGDEPVRAELAAGRGVVMALAHQGNWDHAGAWSSLALAPVTTVAERLEPRQVFSAFLAFRERLGMTILPLEGGPPVFPTLLRALRDGAFVPLLADRDLSATGVEVALFGEPARMAAGPATLALAAGTALFPVTIRYERLPAGVGARWGQVVHFHPRVPAPADGDRASRVAAMTQACADALGAGIAAYPQDWHMLHRVFTADLEPLPAVPSR